MGKRTCAKKAQEPWVPDPTCRPPTGTWKDELTGEERAEEKSKMQVRKKEAEEAAGYQQVQIARRVDWERQQKNRNLEQQSEDRKWKKPLAKVLTRAKQEGVLEAEDWGDGMWCANLGNGNFKEVKDRYFCTLCNKHLNGGSLEAHLDSAAHRCQASWDGGGPSVQQEPEKTSSSRWTLPCSQTSVQVEEWQELAHDGRLRCLPCNKFANYFHLASNEHCKRLDWWLQVRKLRKSGYAPPELPYLAWAFGDSDPSGDRCLKCLLCNKWVHDQTSHTGMPSSPAGSKYHFKRLGNYAWYKDDVEKLRNKYHPCQTQPKPPQPSLAPWAAAATPSPWAKFAPQPIPAASLAAPPAPPAPPVPPDQSSTIAVEIVEV